MPLALPLDFIGATGCELLVDPFIRDSRSQSSGGYPGYVNPIPDDPSLVTLPFRLQAITVDLAANRSGIITSTAITTVIGS